MTPVNPMYKSFPGSDETLLNRFLHYHHTFRLCSALNTIDSTTTPFKPHRCANAYSLNHLILRYQTFIFMSMLLRIFFALSYHRLQIQLNTVL